MSLVTKVISCAALGGAVTAISLTLLATGHYAQRHVFNAALGAFLIFVATRLGLDLTERKPVA